MRNRLPSSRLSVICRRISNKPCSRPWVATDPAWLAERLAVLIRAPENDGVVRIAQDQRIAHVRTKKMNSRPSLASRAVTPYYCQSRSGNTRDRKPPPNLLTESHLL